MGGGGIDQRADRLRREFHLLLQGGELLIKLSNTRGRLFFLAGDVPQFGQQRLPAFVIVINDKRWSDGGELVIQREGGIPAGSANQNQIRHLCGYGLGAGFADVQARELTFFRDGAPLTQKSPIVGHAVVRRGCAAGDHRRINRQ